MRNGTVRSAHSVKPWKNDNEENTLEITKATTMGQILDYDLGIVDVLVKAGMHCVGCPSSIHESLKEACQVHGLDVDRVLYTNLSIGKIGGLKDGTNQPVVLY